VESDAVLIDNFGGAVAGTDRLLAAGHRRIAVLGFTREAYTVAERLRGIEHAMAEAGVDLDPALVRLGALKEDQAAAEVASLLELPDPPTAIFCCNNRMTIGAVDEVDRRGADIDIVGFDEVSYASFLPTPVTLITYDVEQLARRAAEMLFKRIDGRGGTPRTMTIRTVLVTRGRRRQFVDGALATARQV
jgi:LacI family transcriptional regulator